MTNPLVAQREDSTTAYSGIQIAESVADTQKAIESGDWASGVMGAVGTGLDALGMAMDPFGAIFSAGVGWLIEHVGPVSDALDSLTGDPDEIKAHSETWKNVSAELDAINTEMKDLVKADTASWLGEAGDAYRKRSEDTANLIAAAKAAADGAADGIGTAGEVVGAVRSLVRDIIAELVGHLVSWALQVVCTLGIAMAWVVPQVVAEVAKVASKIADITTKLIKAMKALTPLLKKLGDGFGDAKKQLDKIKADGAKNDGPASTKTASADDKPRGGDNSTQPPGENRGDGNASTASQHADGDASRAGNGNARTEKSAARPEDPVVAGRDRVCKPGSGDPVDPATGDMFDSAVDVRIEAALPLVLQRSHISSYRAGRLFGRTWASTVDQRLEFDARGVVFAAEDGALLVYPEPPEDGGSVLPEAGPRWPLARTAEGYRIWRPLTGEILYFGKEPVGIAPIVAVADGNGSRIDFDYEAGALVGIRHSGGHYVDVIAEDGLIKEFRLRDRTGAIPLVRYSYEHERLAEVINSSGESMRFSYDADGRITRWVDRNGEWYEYHYDADGRVVRTEGSGGALTGEWEYDGSTTLYTDACGHTTRFDFNEAHQLIRETDPLGHVTSSEWDGHNNLLSRVDPLGRTVRYRYTELGEVAAIIRPDGAQQRAEFDEFGRRTAVVEPDGGVWRYAYDERGNRSSVTDPSGAVTTYAYDDRGHLEAMTDPAGGVHRWETDAAGRVLVATDSEGASIRYTRDQFGRVATTTDPAGNVTRFRWSIEGRLLSRTLPDGSVESWRYDAEGNEVGYVDEAGKGTVFETTHFDLVSAEVRPDGSRIEFAYDAALRLTEVRAPNGLAWQYRYDGAGNLLAEIDYDGREIRYSYDAAGQLVERVNGAGEVTRFVRDELGNVVEKHAGGRISRFEYDAAERLVRAVNADADVVLERDARGRVLREAVNGRALEFRYDAAGRRVYRRTPTGAESIWSHDADHRATGLRTAGRRLDFDFDAVGREVRRRVDTGAELTQRWDARDQLVEQTMSVASDDPAHRRPVQQRRYRYFADGHLAGVDDPLSGTRSFELDAAGQVLAVRGADRSERYSYDEVGNLLQAAWRNAPGAEPDAQGARSYRANRLQTAGGLSYIYDAQGRVVVRQRKRLSRKPDAWHFSWDAEDRLVGVVTPDGVRWIYRYDALGRRVAKQRLAADGVTVAEQVDFTWDDVALVEQVHNGRHATVWNYGQDEGVVPITQTERMLTPEQHWADTAFYSIVTDLIGMPTELVDPRGNLAWQARSTVWGEPLAATGGPATTPLRFPGQYFDAETGLHYNVHRYYDPSTARFTSNDPLGLDPSPNPAAYVHNPLTWMDPLGLTGRPGGCSGGSRDVVYRNLREDEDPRKGLFAKDWEYEPKRYVRGPKSGEIKYDDMGTPSGHVGNGSGENFKSRFISTTKDYGVAEKFREPGQRTVAIDLKRYKELGGGGAGSVLDVSTEAGRAKATFLCGGGWGSTAKGYATGSQEVLLGGAVHPGAITQVHPKP
ncbi:RHS repeat-associated core domain-containing protein [Saccharopolyspora flava]|uniref:RHS repeat-associated core domain-containing protein n=1 Tax=Saccharopolyspora flava TaxID=95161 RepID=A0A1I6V5F6_9PSEU|nr:RHS repeat-associated core domain-containing protein [Saccharopolyspora flava]SFT08923.1 RHS repeat-associated core domain-containing protein [Saccharopolyspora flava]